MYAQLLLARLAATHSMHAPSFYLLSRPPPPSLVTVKQNRNRGISQGNAKRVAPNAVDACREGIGTHISQVGGKETLEAQRLETPRARSRRLLPCVLPFHLNARAVLMCSQAPRHATPRLTSISSPSLAAPP